MSADDDWPVARLDCPVTRDARDARVRDRLLPRDAFSGVDRSLPREAATLSVSAARTAPPWSAPFSCRARPSAQARCVSSKLVSHRFE